MPSKALADTLGRLEYLLSFQMFLPDKNNLRQVIRVVMAFTNDKTGCECRTDRFPQKAVPRHHAKTLRGGAGRFLVSLHHA